MGSRVSDLFTISYGHSLELIRLTQAGGPTAVNFVSRSAKNNGVSARVARIEDIEPAAGGLITVALSGSVLEAFVQPAPFYTGFHVGILTPRREMSLSEKLWWAYCIRANKYRYNYGRQANRTLGDIQLPDYPEWAKVATTPDFSYAALPQIDAGVELPDSSAWKTFTYDELFDFEHGTRVTKQQLVPGTTPFIRATERDNGIAAYADLPAHPGGVMTVSYNGSVGEAFYQPDPFFASDDVFVLTPKSDISPATQMFLCAIIRAEKYRFNYGRKWNMERMKASTMKLPVDGSGRPDWSLMRRYILALPFGSMAPLEKPAKIAS